MFFVCNNCFILWIISTKASYLTCGMLNVLLTSFNECASRVCLKGLEPSWLRTYWNKNIAYIKKQPLVFRQLYNALYRAFLPTRLAATHIYRTKQSDYMRKELNSHRAGLGHQSERSLIVWKHQYGCLTSDGNNL